MPPGTIARINPLSYRTTTVYDVAGRSIGSIDPLYNRTTNDAVPVRPILYALLFTGFEKVNLSYPSDEHRCMSAQFASKVGERAGAA